jgi:hypothetical protein
MMVSRRIQRSNMLDARRAFQRKAAKMTAARQLHQRLHHNANDASATIAAAAGGGGGGSSDKEAQVLMDDSYEDDDDDRTASLRVRETGRARSHQMLITLAIFFTVTLLVVFWCAAYFLCRYGFVTSQWSIMIKSVCLVLIVCCSHVSHVDGLVMGLLSSMSILLRVLQVML